MVKRVECGFLALNNTIAVGNPKYLGEASWEWRKANWRNYAGMLVNSPVCFVMAIDMSAQMGERTGVSQQIWEIIAAERDCTGFTKWRQGFSPKEHQEMLDRQWMIEQENKRRRTDSWFRIIELFLTFITIVAIVVAAWIGNVFGK